MFFWRKKTWVKNVVTQSLYNSFLSVLTVFSRWPAVGRRQTIYYRGEEAVSLEKQLAAADSTPGLHHPPLTTSTPLQHEAVLVMETPDTASGGRRDVSDGGSSENDATAAPKTAADIATTSVRDLRKAFDSFATTSDVSLLDHVARRKVRSLCTLSTYKELRE